MRFRISLGMQLKILGPLYDRLDDRRVLSPLGACIGGVVLLHVRPILFDKCGVTAFISDGFGT